MAEGLSSTVIRLRPVCSGEGDEMGRSSPGQYGLELSLRGKIPLGSKGPEMEALDLLE